MPAMIVWPVSSSVLTWKVGSLLGEAAGFAMPSLSWSPLVLGSIATLITGAGKVIDSRTTGLAMSAERVAGGGVLQPHDRHDLTSDRRRGALPRLLACILVDLADPLLAALDRVQHRRAGGQACPSRSAGRVSLPRVLVGHDLESGARRNGSAGSAARSMSTESGPSE